MIRIHIRHNPSGETRVYHDDYEWEDVGDFLWMWTEGNYGCDCNRDLFFHRAVGAEAITDVPCGRKIYSVPFAVLSDGTRVEIDAAEKTEVCKE